MVILLLGLTVFCYFLLKVVRKQKITPFNNVPEKKPFLSFVLESLPVAVLLIDKTGTILYINERTAHLLKRGRDDIIHRRLDSFIDHFSDMLNAAKQAKHHGMKRQLKIKLPNERSLPSYCWMKVLDDTQFICVMENISDLKQKEKELKYLSRYDFLTELPNHLQLEDHLIRQINKTSRKRERFALLHVDINGLSKINQEYGSDIGNLVLKKTAEKLRKLLRKEDFIARHFNDEFVICIDDMNDERGIKKIVEKIKTEFKSPTAILNRIIPISVDIAFVIYPTHGKTISALFDTLSNKP